MRNINVIALCICALPLAASAGTYEERAIASVLMGEAWSDGRPGMTAVAEVIHQRTVEKKEAPFQVISAHRGRVHAFSCLNGTTINQLIEKFDIQPGYNDALQLAKLVCRSPERLPGMACSANHYTRVDERPYWARGKRPVAIIGNHAFYRLEHY